jgi:uncharacterized protein (TIGR02118 family)
MSFCFFALFSEPFVNVDAAIVSVSGLQRAYVYAPDSAHDPFLNDGPPPPLVLQLYFDSLPALEAACDGRLQILKSRCEVEAMLVRPFTVPEAKMPGCTYLVAYEGSAEDENAWHAHYLKHHPPLMARLPGIRELEIYTPVTWVSDAGWRRNRSMQRNKVAFDSAEALTAALHSPVRAEMRSEYASLPPFTGNVTHYPMATRALSIPARSSS